MKISVLEIFRRQQGIILFLMFLLYYLHCYTAASIVLILWGLAKGRKEELSVETLIFLPIPQVASERC